MTYAICLMPYASLSAPSPTSRSRSHSASLSYVLRPRGSMSQGLIVEYVKAS
jgi:hypothetical protein